MPWGFGHLVAVIALSSKEKSRRLLATLTADICVKARPEALAHFATPEIFSSGRRGCG